MQIFTVSIEVHDEITVCPNNNGGDVEDRTAQSYVCALMGGPHEYNSICGEFDLLVAFSKVDFGAIGVYKCLGSFVKK